MENEIIEINVSNLTDEDYAKYKKIYNGTLPAIFFVKIENDEIIAIHKYNIWTE